MFAKWSLPQAVVLAAAAAAPALGQLSSLRATIPGSLHQCEMTNLFFFDSSNTRPLSVLFLPSSEVPDSIRTGDVTLEEAQQYSPLLALSDIETPDAAQYDLPNGLQIEQGAVFELFAFLPDGTGKALSLTRTVSTPLPGASSCLTNIPTSISDAGATTAASSQATSASASTAASSTADASSSAASSSAAASSATSASSSRMSSRASSTSASQTGSSSATSGSSAASSSSAAASGSSAASPALGLDTSVLLAWSVALGGAALVGTGLLA